MIILHKLNGNEFALNSNHIEAIQANPDTTITLTNDKIYIVKEPVAEIIEKIRDYQNSVLYGASNPEKSE